MSMPPAALTIQTGALLARSMMMPTYASLAMSSAGAIRTFSTVSPLICSPRMAFAFSRASSGVLASFTPPALPRPPACTCAFTTTAPPSFRAICSACSGVVATSPMGTGIPCAASSSFAWYSWMFTDDPCSG
jgi:hypothetical protein